MADLIRIDDVSAGYGEAMVLENVSLSLAAGESLALLGRNGVGKTTLLVTLVGLTRLHRGRIHLSGRDITRLPTYQRARAGLGWVPQERAVFPSLTVEEHLTAVGRPGAWNRERIWATFPRLAARRGHWGWQLSGGEQQMLAISRALLARPKLMMLDEPSLGLSPLLVERLFDLIVSLRKEGIAILLVEQNTHMALEVASRGIVMELGNVVLEGSAGALRDNEKLADAYLGHAN
jgi:branched-chain amino acid transport system ATP-binding protein